YLTDKRTGQRPALVRSDWTRGYGIVSNEGAIRLCTKANLKSPWPLSVFPRLTLRAALVPHTHRSTSRDTVPRMWLERAQSALGIVVVLFLAWLLGPAKTRRRAALRPVALAFVLLVVVAVLLLKTPL